MIISIGSDHAGYEYKEIIKKHLIDKGYEAGIHLSYPRTL